MSLFDTDIITSNLLEGIEEMDSLEALNKIFSLVSGGGDFGDKYYQIDQMENHKEDMEKHIMSTLEIMKKLRPEVEASANLRPINCVQRSRYIDGKLQREFPDKPAWFTAMMYVWDVVEPAK